MISMIINQSAPCICFSSSWKVAHRTFLSKFRANGCRHCRILRVPWPNYQSTIVSPIPSDSVVGLILNTGARGTTRPHVGDAFETVAALRTAFCDTEDLLSHSTKTMFQGVDEPHDFTSDCIGTALLSFIIVYNVEIKSGNWLFWGVLDKLDCFPQKPTLEILRYTNASW